MRGFDQGLCDLSKMTGKGANRDYDYYKCQRSHKK